MALRARILTGAPASGRDSARQRPARAVGWGPAAAGLLALQLAAVVLVASAQHQLAWTAALLMASALAGVDAVIVHRDHRRTRNQHAAVVALLRARVEAAEAASQHKQLILHEVKTRVDDVVSASRLLQARGVEPAGDTARGLEQMRRAELRRLERLLTRDSSLDGPHAEDASCHALSA